jgi:hypothetical protein
MNKLEAYSLLQNNNDNIIHCEVDGDIRVYNRVSVNLNDPTVEYDSLTTPFLYVIKDKAINNVIRITWKTVKSINGVPYIHGK